jgi:hypothetical protein
MVVATIIYQIHRSFSQRNAEEDPYTTDHITKFKSHNRMFDEPISDFFTQLDFLNQIK